MLLRFVKFFSAELLHTGILLDGVKNRKKKQKNAVFSKQLHAKYRRRDANAQNSNLLLDCLIKIGIIAQQFVFLEKNRQNFYDICLLVLFLFATTLLLALAVCFDASL